MEKHLLCVCCLQHSLYGTFINPPTWDVLLFLEECCEDLRHSHTFQTFHSCTKEEKHSFASVCIIVFLSHKWLS